MREALRRGQTIARRYEVLELVHRSEAVDTYRAIHARTGYLVEIEVVRADAPDKATASRMLRDAARRRCRLGHPAVLMPIDLGTLGDGTFFVVSRPPDGVTLREHVCSNGPLAREEATVLARSLLSVVVTAHDQSVTLGAVDPDGILLPRSRFDGTVGCLRFVGNLPADSAFRAPELGDGAEPTPASDFYACGATLFFACTGHTPAERGAFAIPSALGRVILRASHLRPDRRYESAHDMLETLDFGTNEVESTRQRMHSETVSIDHDELRARTSGTIYEQVASPVAVNDGLDAERQNGTTTPVKPSRS